MIPESLSPVANHLWQSTLFRWSCRPVYVGTATKCRASTVLGLGGSIAEVCCAVFVVDRTGQSYSITCCVRARSGLLRGRARGSKPAIRAARRQIERTAPTTSTGHPACRNPRRDLGMRLHGHNYIVVGPLAAHCYCSSGWIAPETWSSDSSNILRHCAGARCFRRCPSSATAAARHRDTPVARGTERGHLARTPTCPLSGQLNHGDSHVH
jgi:hypothetical protein